MSALCDDKVVFFKSISENENENDDAYSSLFRSASFDVNLIPVLDFEFINLEKLLDKLNKPNDYEGIIFSSPRCVMGVDLALQSGNVMRVLDEWKKHKHFVVGEKTAHVLGNLGLSADGKEAGNAKNLADIISKGQYEKPFLYPKGSLTKDTFKSLLKENGINVDDITIYQTKPHPELESNIKRLQLNYTKEVYFVYFSPSGVNFTLPILKELQFKLDQIQFVAIGPTTEGALQENGLKVAAISAKPHPHSLLNAVLSCKKIKEQ